MGDIVARSLTYVSWVIVMGSRGCGIVGLR